MPLNEDLMARHGEIERRLAGHRVAYELGPLATPVDLGRPAGELLGQALDLPDLNTTSWLPGMPLAALLAAGRRITVDLAPPFLENFRRSYGIPEQALLDFARAGMLLLNLRDFDPAAPAEQREREAAAYEPWRPLLDRVLDEAPEATYFLSALRPRIFDAIPPFLGPRAAPKPTLADAYGLAARDLAAAEAAADALGRTDVHAIRAMFRAEFPPAKATYWHWAYVQAVARFVEPEFAAYLQAEYDWLADEGRASGRGEGAGFELGTRFVAFQLRMRYAHLLYSAPLSASFGGPYGYSLDDDHVFLQAVERQFAWREDTPFEYDYFSDDLLDLIQDLQAGPLRPRFAERLEPRHLEALSSLGTEAYCRTERTTYFDHYSDAANRAELIDYWHDRSWKRVSYEGLQSQLDALLGRDGLAPRDLIDLAALRDDARTSADRALRKHTEGYQIVSTPARSRRVPGRVLATDPKEPHLLMRLLVALGLRTGNGWSAVGKRGDHARVAYSAGAAFRNAPM